MIDKAKIEEWKARVAMVEAARASAETSDALAAAFERFGEGTLEAVPALLSERESLLSLLREVEWKGATGTSYDPDTGCPVCAGSEPTADMPIGSYPDVGHAPDCRLSVALRGTP
jgi:hypothetical protein